MDDDGQNRGVRSSRLRIGLVAPGDEERSAREKSRAPEWPGSSSALREVHRKDCTTWKALGKRESPLIPRRPSPDRLLPWRRRQFLDRGSFTPRDAGRNVGPRAGMRLA